MQNIQAVGTWYITEGIELWWRYHGLHAGRFEETEAVLHHTSCVGSPGIRKYSGFVRPLNTGQTSPCPCYWHLCDLKCEIFYEFLLLGKFLRNFWSIYNTKHLFFPPFMNLGPGLLGNKARQWMLHNLDMRLWNKLKILFNDGIVWWRWLVFGFIEMERPSCPTQGRSCTIATHEIERILGNNWKCSLKIEIKRVNTG